MGRLATLGGTGKLAQEEGRRELWSMSFVGTLRIHKAPKQAGLREVGMLEGTGNKKKQPRNSSENCISFNFKLTKTFMSSFLQ